MKNSKKYADKIDFLFLQQFPDGLSDPHWLSLGKKHKSYESILQIFRTSLNKEAFKGSLDAGEYADLISIITKALQKSTMISMFEKVAFKNFISYENVHQDFLETLYDFLYVDYKKYFNDFVGVLGSLRDFRNANAAKWTVVSFFLSHCFPEDHIFIKPTTVKMLGEFYNYDIIYKSLPNITTYENVREIVNDFKKNSMLASGNNNIIVQAIIFCGINSHLVGE